MSKWDKLLMRISNLSKDIRFDELRKVMESYGYKMRRGVEAVIIHLGNQAVSQLQYPDTNQLKKYM